MRKRITSLLLAFVLCLTLLPTVAFAADEEAGLTGAGTAEGKVDITGSGAPDDPYLIYTAAGLKTFRDIVNGENGQTQNSGAHAKLMNDIVLNDGTFDKDGNYTPGESGKAAEEWTPIGWFELVDRNHPYTGTFDGGGYTIKGLYVKDEQCAGLFGYAANAAIKNLAVDGYISTTVDQNRSGGIVGRLSGGTVTGCFNSCTINTTGLAGGIVGQLNQNGQITDCGNAGTISGKSFKGGIVGSANGGNYNIQSCYNIGRVSSDRSTGGIAGSLGDNGLVHNCYWLTGTATVAAGVMVDNYVDKSSASKLDAEFADGTVLELLKNNRTDSPWGACGYLEAAGMVVPLLKWQTADAHTCTPGAVLGQCDCGLSVADGTAEEPYEIYTADHLKQFRDIVNGQNGQTQNSDAHAKLTCDIVLNDGTFDADGNWSESGTPNQWTPIVGNYGYGGTFDGDGHTIRGLYVKGGEYAGLFGNVWGGTVKNVTVTGYVEGTKCVGGIVGYVNNATVSGCTNAAVVKAKCDGRFVDVGGIVGYFYANGNVGNCANLGSVWAQIDSNQGMAKVGGIAGGLGDLNVTIADCYNAGSIAIEDSGTGEYDFVSYLGGIVGSTLMTLEPSYISNCYSVGPLTYSGSASAVICGIAGFVNSYDIINCYWLEGTAESGVGGDPRQVTNTSAHTNTDFADGTVLDLLKNNRTDSPWADECQYLAASGMTLPVFKGQGDSHTHSEKTGDCTKGIYCECGYLMHGAESEHNWGEWQHLTTSHTRTCNNPGCGMTQSGNCSGGTATCTKQAVCETCGESYGNTNPDNHTDIAEWIQTATKHTQKYKCCGAITVAEEAHEWENGVCTECHYACAHSGGSVCSVCGRVLRSSRDNDSSDHSYPISVDKTEHGSVSVSPRSAEKGDTVTVTVTPDKGYTLETLTVTDKDGNELKLTDKGGGKYAFTMPSGSVTVTATFMDDNTMLNFFVDVKASDYYYDAVLWAAQKGITSGTDAVHFSPSLPCTRAQIVTFLWRAAGCPVVNYAMNMTDVSEDAYYAEAVRWALSLGITDGTTATTFSPDETCTRAQAVAFLFRYAAPEAVTLQELVSGFSDAASVPGYALASMNWALAEDIVQGDGTKLMPNDSCTRAQIVTFLYRTLAK